MASRLTSLSMKAYSDLAGYIVQLQTNVKHGLRTLGPTLVDHGGIVFSNLETLSTSQQDKFTLFFDIRSLDIRWLLAVTSSAAQRSCNGSRPCANRSHFPSPQMRNGLRPTIVTYKRWLLLLSRRLNQATLTVSTNGVAKGPSRNSSSRRSYWREAL